VRSDELLNSLLILIFVTNKKRFGELSKWKGKLFTKRYLLIPKSLTLYKFLKDYNNEKRK